MPLHGVSPHMAGFIDTNLRVLGIGVISLILGAAHLSFSLSFLSRIPLSFFFPSSAPPPPPLYSPPSTLTPLFQIISLPLLLRRRRRCRLDVNETDGEDAIGSSLIGPRSHVRVLAYVCPLVTPNSLPPYISDHITSFTSHVHYMPREILLPLPCHSPP